jgi:hypothetical protein
MTSVPRETDSLRGPLARHRRRLVLAGDFAQQATGRRVVEPWMIAGLWCLHVGCDECADQGPAAACWARTSCHGYTNGCGCTDCAARQVYDIQVAAGVPRTVAGRRAS